MKTFSGVSKWHFSKLFGVLVTSLGPFLTNNVEMCKYFICLVDITCPETGRWVTITPVFTHCLNVTCEEA